MEVVVSLVNVPQEASARWFDRATSLLIGRLVGQRVKHAAPSTAAPFDVTVASDRVPSRWGVGGVGVGALSAPEFGRAALARALVAAFLSHPSVATGPPSPWRTVLVFGTVRWMTRSCTVRSPGSATAP